MKALAHLALAPLCSDNCLQLTSNVEAKLMETYEDIVHLVEHSANHSQLQTFSVEHML